MLNSSIAQELLSEFEGCDNDRPGNACNRAIWLFGIEPGYSLADKLQSASSVSEQRTSDHIDDGYSIERQLKWPFNKKAFKLLTAIDGGNVSDYVEFAHTRKPFVRNSDGFFKGNIYPYACNNVEDWPVEVAAEVGCTKDEYRRWCNDFRVPEVHKWVRKYLPKVFIGVGVSYRAIFTLAAFGKDVNLSETSVVGKSQIKKLHYAKIDGITLVVIPHFSGPYGLNCDQSIQATGEFIAGLIS